MQYTAHRNFTFSVIPPICIQINRYFRRQSAKSPLELVDGFVGDVTIVIPWSTLMESTITVEIKNLEMTVRFNAIGSSLFVKKPSPL